MFILIIAVCKVTFAQETLFKSKYPEGNNLLWQFKTGLGLPFAGFCGVGNEWRAPYWSIYYSCGYMYAYTLNKRIIKESINFGGGLRWYLLHPSNNTRLRFGIHGGWLNNYYYPEEPYDPTVYGIAFSSGVLWQKGYFSFGFDVMFDPGKLIFSPNTHPDYGLHYYWSPSFDLGLNLAKFYVTPFRFNKYNSIKAERKNGIFNNTNNTKISTNMLIKSCIGEKKQSSDGFYCQYNQFYYIFCNLSENRKLIISIAKDSISLKSNICNKFRVSKNNLPIKISMEIANENNFKKYDAKDGLIHLFIQKYLLHFGRQKFKTLHVKISNLVLINENQEQIDEILVDEIVLFDIPFQKYYPLN